jgi:hypothetical protein
MIIYLSVCPHVTNLKNSEILLLNLIWGSFAQLYLHFIFSKWKKITEISHENLRFVYGSVEVTNCFDVLLTVHLSLFILVINQFDAHSLFYNKFISCLYMFRAPCAHRQEVKIVLYSLWYHHTYRCSCN